MLTPEETHALTEAGAHQVVLKCGKGFIDNATFLEALMYANTVINDAMMNGEHNDITIRSERRDRLAQQAAGILFLTLQHHGDALYTTHALQRNLHATQAPKKALLLEHQFIAGEAEKAFAECLDASSTGQPHDPQAWARLRGAMQKLGAKV